MIKIVKKPSLVKIIKEMMGDIENGLNLSESLEKHPKVFRPMYVNLVKIGESSGNLDGVLEQMAIIDQKIMDIQGKVQGAMVYPLLLLVMGLSVVGFVVATILPKFADIIKSMGVKLPMSTEILLAVSAFANKNGLMVFIMLVVVIFAIKRYTRSASGKRLFDFLTLKIPVVGEVMTTVVASNFTKALAVLIKAGVPMNKSLEITRDAEQNSIVKESLEQVRGDVIGGKTLAKALEETKVFPTIVVQMIEAGEASGSLERMTRDVSDFLDSEVERTVGVLTTLAEPVMLIVMGGLVGFIVLSVLLPVCNVTKGFQ